MVDLSELENRTVSVDVLAELFNVTPRWIRQLAKDGILPTPKVGKLPLIAACQAYVRHHHRRAMLAGSEAAIDIAQETIAAQAAQIRALTASPPKRRTGADN